MLDVPGHLPSLLHFERAGCQLVGANHLRSIERDATRRFHQYHRHGGRNRIRRGDVGGFDARHGERAVFGLVAPSGKDT